MRGHVRARTGDAGARGHRDAGTWERGRWGVGAEPLRQGRGGAESLGRRAAGAEAAGRGVETAHRARPGEAARRARARAQAGEGAWGGGEEEEDEGERERRGLTTGIQISAITVSKT
jgi:hypothetical protein